jgi:TolB protein
MSQNLFTKKWMMGMAAGLAAATLCAADQAPIIIQKPGDMSFTPPTPITITGFSGEVAQALNFDLTVMGFTNVPAGSAQFTLSGANNPNVQGQLSAGKNVLLSRAYTGPNIRAQAHRLADEVVLKLTSVNGIAETKIAFKRVTGSRSSEIYVSDYDGFESRPVTEDHTDSAAPCWVPKQMALYYTSYKLGVPNIFYQNVSSGQRRNFSHYPGLNTSAAVSPDGSKVALILSKGGSPDLYVLDADGSNLKQLTQTPEDESSPCWSPDGRWICYAAKTSERRALWKISPEGGTPHRIPTSGVSNPSEPDWSPDGQWIVFTSQMGNFEICVVKATGEGVATPLTQGEDASWAPNSRTIVFVRGSRGNRQLAVMDVPTRQIRDAHMSGASNTQPSWAR